ncbi:MAG TPA: DUF3109 family protein [Bacteroidales bacterium]|jgi:hypothetical protein|nr:DUF3109 family protein [Bacteroidales bacterium]
MHTIGKAVISSDLITSNFHCNLDACKGACCVSGDSGAPLEPEETKILEEIYPVIKCYLSEESVNTIETLGTWVIDVENDTVTPLNDGKECAYVVFENGIALCAIEKAYNDGLINFRKPVSCHLYPVRIKKYRHHDAVNYDHWEICNPAIFKGNLLKTPVYQFTRDALERKYGKEWFNQLVLEAKNLNIERV